MAALTGVEKNRINGHVIPMENYGSLQTPGDDDTINFAAADELVSALCLSWHVTISFCITSVWWKFINMVCTGSGSGVDTNVITN